MAHENGIKLDDGFAIPTDEQIRIALCRLVFFLGEDKYASLDSRRKSNLQDSISEPIMAALLGHAVKTPGSKGTGDARDPKDNAKCEYKATTAQKGPSSFGPQERFDHLFFGEFDFSDYTISIWDMHKTYDDMLPIVTVKKTGETFGDKCDAGKRPRLDLRPYKSEATLVVDRFSIEELVEMYDAEPEVFQHVKSL